MTFDDLLRLQEVDELTISAEGRWVAFTRRSRFHANSNELDDGILILDRDSGITHVVRTTGRPHALQWTTRGDVLGFLTSAGSGNRLWRYEPRGTPPPRPLLEPELVGDDVLAYAWNATGDSVAYVAPESGVSASQQGTGRVKMPPGLVLFRDSPGDFTGGTSRSYRRDSVGAYLAVTGIDGGAPRVLAHRLISQKISPTVDWSRTGALLVSGAPIGVKWFDQLTTRSLYTVDVSSGALQEIPPQTLARLAPTWSPSGRYIASREYHSFSETRGREPMYVLRVDDPARPGRDKSFTYGDYGAPSSFGPKWGADDNSLYLARFENGTSRLYALDITSRRWRALTPDSLFVSQYAVTRDGKTILAVLENARLPQRIYSIDPVTGTMSAPLFGIDTLPRLRLGRVQEVAWRSSDERFTVHGFLVKPPDYDPSRRYPLIVLVHGGPGALFTNSFVTLNFWQQGYLPPQWFAQAGYLVLMPNPRGDGSYGGEFKAAIQGDWGPGPLSDVESGVASLVAAGLVDSTAVGMAGTSYGAYLAAFAITQTRRFAAVSLDDGPMDLRADYGVNYAFHSHSLSSFFGGTPWMKPEMYAAQSPITFVERARTPVLMRFGGKSATDDDVRQAYMLSQGFEFYAGLHDAGVPVQFVLHPNQGHGITDWDLYKDWVIRNLRWFNFWLRHEGPRPEF